jgi:predicted acyl esterase
VTGGFRRHPVSSILNLLACLLIAACASTAPKRLPEVTAKLVEVTTTDGVRLGGALWIPSGGPGTRPAL